MSYSSETRHIRKPIPKKLVDRAWNFIQDHPKISILSLCALIALILTLIMCFSIKTENEATLNPIPTSTLEETLEDIPCNITIQEFESYESIFNHINYEKFIEKKCYSLDYDCDLEMEPTIKNYPFLVGIVLKQFNETLFGCIGSFIQNDMILTAAHCEQPENNISISEIYFYNSLTNNMTILTSDQFQFIRHPKFELNNFEKNYDLAQIKLKNSVPVHTLCLPINETSLPNAFTSLEFIDDGSVYRTKIKEVPISVVDVNDCKKQYEMENKRLRFYENKVDNNLDWISLQIIICGSNGGNYTQTGISGSPLLVSNGHKLTSYGLLSMGGSEGKNLTDVYMNNGAFITWILDNTSSLL